MKATLFFLYAMCSVLILFTTMTFPMWHGMKDAPSGYVLIILIPLALIIVATQDKVLKYFTGK